MRCWCCRRGGGFGKAFRREVFVVYLQSNGRLEIGKQRQGACPQERGQTQVAAVVSLFFLARRRRKRRIVDSSSVRYPSEIHLRDHALDVEVREDDLDALADLGVEEVVALGVARVEPGEVGAPESAVRRHGAVVAEGARHRRDLLARRDPEIYIKR